MSTKLNLLNKRTCPQSVNTNLQCSVDTSGNVTITSQSWLLCRSIYYRIHLALVTQTCIIYCHLRSAGSTQFTYTA